MAYFINLFSPETYQAFSGSNRDITGFRERQKNVAVSVKQGDKLVCYMTKVSRWVGILEVVSPFFLDDSPIFIHPLDPFTLRFKVTPKVWLPPEYTIPIYEDNCWKNLSFTKNLAKNSTGWTGIVRGSLRKLEETDGLTLEQLLLKQLENPKKYQFNEAERRKMQPSIINASHSQIVVTVPEEEKENKRISKHQQAEQHESFQMQALLAQIGERMNLKIWLPRNDRQRVLEFWHPEANSSLLDRLPLNYDDVTLRTIENIDVLWIRNRSIIRAFEVEHTTSIYSGILRMADLMALQPNLSIKANIVAPLERRVKVMQEIKRPVFALLEKGPLAESCTYLSYESVKELAQDENLEYMRDNIIEKYAEYAEESDL